MKFLFIKPKQEQGGGRRGQTQSAVNTTNMLMH